MDSEKVSLVLKVSPELAADFKRLVSALGFGKHNVTFEHLVERVLERHGKSLDDKAFQRPPRRQF